MGSPEQFNFNKDAKIVGGEDERYNIDEIRKKWDKEKVKIIDEQLNKEIMVEVQDDSGKTIKIEGRFLSVNPGQKCDKKTLAIVPGWGVSYKGLEELAKTIALESERPVVIISMPGYGKSDDAPSEWSNKDNKDNFNNESSVAHKAIEEIRKINGDDNSEIAVLGHSMGGMVAAAMAEKENNIKDLVLVHTAGVKKEGFFSLVNRFTMNSIGEGNDKIRGWRKSKRDKEWLDEFKRYLGTSLEIGKNLSSIEKLKLHFYKEVNALAEGNIKKTIGNFNGNLITVTGSEEKLFPASEAEELNRSAFIAKSTQTINMMGGKHTGPMNWTEIYGAAVAAALDRLEEQNK